MQRQYLCIDLKSFYASVECIERGLDPMTTDLVVADPERSDKTICLAVSPSLKAKGVKNRCRVFEIPDNLDYIMAVPRMKKYIDYSADVYEVYLKYFSCDDIHVYSIDEVFIDVTYYLALYKSTAKQLAVKIMDEVYKTIGVRATCGIGTNLYLAKVALDITAKHSADFIGVLDEKTFREKLWEHKPLSDFWRIGKGTSQKLAEHCIFTMKDIACAPECTLYKLFGIDAELLIDHAYGIEPTTIEDIKAYKPKNNSLTSGQVLMKDYDFEDAKIIVKEMTDALCLEMLKRELVTDSVTLHIGYSNSLKMPPAHSTVRISHATDSELLIIPAVSELYDKIADKRYGIKRINISFNNVKANSGICQLPLIDDDAQKIEKNKRLRKAVINIKEKYGGNAVLKGIDFKENATARERNCQIGGHKSGE